MDARELSTFFVGGRIFFGVRLFGVMMEEYLSDIEELIPMFPCKLDFALIDQNVNFKITQTLKDVNYSRVCFEDLSYVVPNLPIDLTVYDDCKRMIFAAKMDDPRSVSIPKPSKGKHSWVVDYSNLKPEQLIYLLTCLENEGLVTLPKNPKLQQLIEQFIAI